MLVYEWLSSCAWENLSQCMTRNVFGNLGFGLMVSMIVCFFLYQEEKKEGAYFSFGKVEGVKLCMLLTLATVLLAPPFPIQDAPVLRLSSMAVCFIVFGITSYTDQKTGLFTAGYPMAGLTLSGILFLLHLPRQMGLATGRAWLMLLLCIGINLLLGVIAYRFADALLYLMGQITIAICMPPTKWLMAMMLGLFIAMVLRFLGGLFQLKKIFVEGKKHLPFTMYLFIGWMSVFFLLG